jgi:hypothetical protein
VIEAFRQSASGFSTDRLLVDPELNAAYLEACQRLGVNMPPAHLNRYLLRLRKAGKLSDFVTRERTTFHWESADTYLFASEIAWRTVFDQTGASLDDIFCNPSLAELFDDTAKKFAPGFSQLEYRWGALALRKAAKSVATRSQLFKYDPEKFEKKLVVYDVHEFDQLSNQAGLYHVSAEPSNTLYVGEALDLGLVLNKQFKDYAKGWAEFEKNLIVKAIPYQRLPCMDIRCRGAKLSLWLVAHQCHLINKSKMKPKLNLLGIKETTA